MVVAIMIMRKSMELRSFKRSCKRFSLAQNSKPDEIKLEIKGFRNFMELFNCKYRYINILGLKAT